MLCFAQSLLKSKAASVMYSLKAARVYGQIESVFLMDLNVSLLVRNQGESLLGRLMGKSWVAFARFLLDLSQVKLCGLELPAGAAFINADRCRWMMTGGQEWGEIGSGRGQFGLRWPPCWKRQDFWSIIKSWKMPSIEAHWPETLLATSKRHS